MHVGYAWNNVPSFKNLLLNFLWCRIVCCPVYTLNDLSMVKSVLTSILLRLLVKYATGLTV